MTAGSTLPADRARAVEQTLGLGVVLVGLIALTGWIIDAPVLKTLGLGQVSVKANAAIALLLCGLATLLGSLPGANTGLRRAAVVALAAGAGAIGLATLVEELFALDFGIDELLFADPAPASRIFRRPGRMSPAVAFCFLALAVALALSALPDRLRLRLPFMAALGTAVATIGAMAVTAYLFDALLGVRWGGAATMALATAAAFMLLGTASLLRARRLQAKPWALGRGGLAGFVIGTVLMLAAAELAAGFALDMQRTTALVVRTQHVLNQLQQLRTDLRSLESAQTTYLLTGDEALIAPRESTKSQLRQRLVALAGALGGGGSAAPDLGPLRAAIERRLAQGDRLIALQRVEGAEAARRAFVASQTPALSREITAIVGPLVERESAVLAGHQLKLNEATTATFLVLPIGSLLGLTALLCGVFYLDKGLANRHVAEEAVLRSREQLQVVFDNLPEAIRVIDRQLTIVQMNPAGATSHGLLGPTTSLAEISALLDVRSADGVSLDVNDWPGARALRGDYVRDFELSMRRRDGVGDPVVVEFTTVPLSIGADGLPVQVLATSRDVTARKRDEAALAASRLRLEHVVENLSSGLLIHGLQADHLRWNRAALAIYELEAETVASKTLPEFRAMFELTDMDGQLVPFDDWPMSRLSRGELMSRVELRVRRLDLDWARVLAFEGARVHDDTGSPLVFVTVTDETARKLAEQQLQQLNTELEERVARRTTELQAKTQELEAFCYSVSHDLKAPLRGIDGYSRLLADEYAERLDGDARMFIGNVRTAAAQMNELIDDLLAYSQQERRTWKPTRVRLRGLVDDLLARRQGPTAIDAVIDIAVDDVTVHADREGLEMALRNLVDNALKFSARSQPPRVQIRSAVHDGRVVLSVEDNGTGFDMRYHDRMFEIFQRLHRAEDYPGTGIGLALVRKAMERMGGRVWAEGRPGEGSVFHLELADARDAPDTVH